MPTVDLRFVRLQDFIHGTCRLTVQNFMLTAHVVWQCHSRIPQPERDCLVHGTTQPQYWTGKNVFCLHSGYQKKLITYHIFKHMTKTKLRNLIFRRTFSWVSVVLAPELFASIVNNLVAGLQSIEHLKKTQFKMAGRSTRFTNHFGRCTKEVQRKKLN